MGIPPQPRARVGKFTDEQLREIELDENMIRLDLTPVEASAARLRQVEGEAERVMCDKNVTHQKSGQKPGPAEILSGGDKKKRSALRQQMSRDKRHVAAAEEYPVFQRAAWRRGQAIDAAAGELSGAPLNRHYLGEFAIQGGAEFLGDPISPGTNRIGGQMAVSFRGQNPRVPEQLPDDRQGKP